MNRSNGVLDALSRNLNAVEKIYFQKAGRWAGVLGATSYKVGDEYAFTSWDPTGETQWGSGTCEITEISEGWVSVEILTNEPEESYVGMTFKMKGTDSDKELIHLYTAEGEDAGISVKISKVEE